MFIQPVPSPSASGGGPPQSGSPVAAPPVRDRRMIRVGWLDLQVELRSGDPDRVPLLMFGGIGAALDVLGPLVDAVDPAVPVIRVDVPGIGGSPATVPLSIPALAGVMADLVDGLGHGTVDVLGYSWGGALAQQFAVQHPLRCRRLVLMSTNTGALSVLPEPAMLAKLFIPRRVVDAAEAARLDDHLHDDLQTAITGARGGDGATGWWGYLTQLGALLGWTSLPFLPFITQPTLVISGADDPIVPVTNARLLADTIPRADLQIVPGGHFGIVHAAADLGARISRFLA